MSGAGDWGEYAREPEVEMLEVGTTRLQQIFFAAA